MLIIICTLAIIIFGVAVGVHAYHHSEELKRQTIKEPESMMDYYFDKYTAKVFPCTLIVSKVYNSESQFLAYDFSQYENKNIVLLTNYTDEERDEEEEVELSVPMPNQKICLMEDGTYLWDTR